MTCYLGNPESSHCGAQKIGSFIFYLKFHFQPIFYPKYLENIIEALLNQSMATKKLLQNLKSTRNKNSSWAQICFFRCFQGKKKTSKYNPLIIWNILTQKSTVLEVRIFPNDHFLSLWWNPTTSSLSSQYKRTEKKENEVRYQNVLSWNLRDWSSNI
jgi:hypothetical protein